VNARRRFHEDAESLFGTQAARGSNNPARTAREHALERQPAHRVGADEAVGPDGIADDGDAFGGHSGTAHLVGLAFGNTYDAIHPAQVPAVEAFVEPDAEALACPAARDGHRRSAPATSGDAAEQVRLVTVAAQYVRATEAQVLGQLADRKPEMWRVVRQLDWFESVTASFAGEGPAAAAFREEEERGPAPWGEGGAQAEHLPLGPAVKRRCSQMYDVHRAPRCAQSSHTCSSLRASTFQS